MRIDGRQPDELRPITVTPDYLRFAEGSCLIEWGKNKVLCAATVEPSVPSWLSGRGSGWVTAEYSMLPRSSKQRVMRDAARSKPNARSIEIQRIIGRSLRAAVDLKAFGERMITVDCDVIEADGGTRTASITGGFIALGLAIMKLREAGQIARNATILRDYVAAVSVGIVEGKCVTDLNYLEDSQAETDMNVVMTGAGSFIEIQGTAEGAPFTPAQHAELLEMATGAIGRIVETQRRFVTLT
jgi:ribonuclease PH